MLINTSTAVDNFVRNENSLTLLYSSLYELLLNRKSFFFFEWNGK